MKTIGIILLVLQVLGLLGSMASGEFFDLFVITGGYDAGRLVGYFLPAIIGVILISKANKKKQ